MGVKLVQGNHRELRGEFSVWRLDARGNASAQHALGSCEPLRAVYTIVCAVRHQPDPVRNQARRLAACRDVGELAGLTRAMHAAGPSSPTLAERRQHLLAEQPDRRVHRLRRHRVELMLRR